VFAVNPNRDTVDGDPSYPSLSDLPEDPTIVDLVVPPWESASVLEEADRLGYSRIWFQPGADTPDLVSDAVRRGFSVQADACIMVRARVARS
jgi:predicted CoA-binding protein